MWKSAGVIPLPKVNSPRKVESDLIPISLTLIINKDMESFVVKWTRPFIKP